MASDLQFLIARKSAVIAQITALASGLPGYGPDTNVDGAKIDNVGYRRSLYEELSMLNAQITISQGPFEEQNQAVT